MKKDSIYTKVCPFLQSKMTSIKDESIPVIVSMKSQIAYTKSNVTALSKRIKYELPIVNGYACDMCISQIKNFYSNPDVDFISYDSSIHSIINIAGKTINSDKIYTLGYTGRGVTVATIDTGISPHRDLIYPTNRIIGFKDFLKNSNKPYDDNGHGTHIACIVRQKFIFCILD